MIPGSKCCRRRLVCGSLTALSHSLVPVQWTKLYRKRCRFQSTGSTLIFIGFIVACCMMRNKSCYTEIAESSGLRQDCRESG